MGNCVTVARQTLTLFVGVRIPIPQPSKVYKKDVTEKSLILSGFFAYFGNVFQADFQRCQKGFFPQNRIRTLQNIFLRYFESSFSKIALFFIAKTLIVFHSLWKHQGLFLFYNGDEINFETEKTKNHKSDKYIFCQTKLFNAGEEQNEQLDFTQNSSVWF